jgi:hypothetical protein
VESKAGVRPDDDDVAEFLAGLGRANSALPPRVETTTSSKTRKPTSPEPRFIENPTRRGKLRLRGKEYSYNHAKEAMVIVLREFAKADAHFLERCSQHPEMQGRKRRYVARTAEELYPDRPDLRDHREQLPGGWFVATNLNNVLKKSIIRVAAEVAGLTFGRDVIVEF